MRRKEEKQKTSGIWKVIKILLLVIGILVVLVAGTILYKANRYPDKVPDVFGYKPMIVLSGSMETYIYTGDLVFVKMVDTDTLKVNDIIAFRNETNTVTTHRIIEIVMENGERFFRTKGDNNNVEDANLVPMSAVEGVYVGKISGLGNYLTFVGQPIGLAVLLLIILVVGLGWLYIINRMDEKKYSKEHEQEMKEFEEFKRRKQEEQDKK